VALRVVVVVIVVVVVVVVVVVAIITNIYIYAVNSPQCDINLFNPQH